MPRQYSNGGQDAPRPSGSGTFGSSAKTGTSLKERVGALKNLRPFLMMVWRTSRGLTAASLVLRLVRAVLPVVTLYVGKLIIDNVVLLVQAPDKPERRKCNGNHGPPGTAHGRSPLARRPGDCIATPVFVRQVGAAIRHLDP